MGADLGHGVQLAVEQLVPPVLRAEGDPAAIRRHRAVLHGQANALGLVRLGGLQQHLVVRVQAPSAVGRQHEDAVGTHQQHTLAIRERLQARRPGITLDGLQRHALRGVLGATGPGAAQHLGAFPALTHHHAGGIGGGVETAVRADTEELQPRQFLHPVGVDAHHPAGFPGGADAGEHRTVVQQRQLGDALPFFVDVLEQRLVGRRPGNAQCLHLPTAVGVAQRFQQLRHQHLAPLGAGLLAGVVPAVAQAALDIGVDRLGVGEGLLLPLALGVVPGHGSLRSVRGFVCWVTVFPGPI